MGVASLGNVTRPIHTLLIGVLALLLCGVGDLLVFHTDLYRSILDPLSRAGSFEDTVSEMSALHTNPLRDVLVIGLAFFPQLLAGPIVRAEMFFSEYIGWRAPDGADVSYGMMRTVAGLVKKIVIADQFAPIVDRYFRDPSRFPGAIDAWAALLAFAMQIYFDFSGYSDIAIGCARLLGFVFPRNFARPYLAVSITEFWHRWHITLSQWLRDYLYIPLGGNRDGLRATLRSIVVTMLLGGLWHGANWTFVAWGAYHGMLLCVERVTGIARLHVRSVALNAMRVLVTFVLAVVGWALCRATSFGEVLVIARALVSATPSAPLLTAWPWMLTFGVVALGIVFFAYERMDRPPR